MHADQSRKMVSLMFIHVALITGISATFPFHGRTITFSYDDQGNVPIVYYIVFSYFIKSNHLVSLNCISNDSVI